MTRLCYLKCDGCQFEYRKSGSGLPGKFGYESAAEILSDAAADGWVTRTLDRHLCPKCAAATGSVPNIVLPLRPVTPAAADLTWD